MEIVIDTNIWVKACDIHMKDSMDCIYFIINFMQSENIKLALDYDGKMMKEYRKNLTQNVWFEKYYIELSRQMRFALGKSDIPRKFISGLDRVHFHEIEDRIFLGRAYNGDKHLVTEDSDYGCNPDKSDTASEMKKDFIVNEMGVTLLDGKSALELLKKVN